MRSVSYPDTWLRIAAIPVLAVLLRHFYADEPVAELLKNSLYYTDLAWHLAMVLIIWETNRYFIQTLDQHYSWITRPVRRAFIQLGLAALVSLTGVFTMRFIYLAVLNFPKSILLSDLFLQYSLPTLLIVLSINALYTGMYLVQYHYRVVNSLRTQVDEAIRAAEKLKLDQLYNQPGERLIVPARHLIANAGYASVPVQTEGIAYLYVLDAVTIKTFDGQDYTVGSSLENLELSLDPAQFFRINQLLIVNVRAIERFNQNEQGKLRLHLIPPFPEDVYVSRKKAAEFKEWLGKKI